MTVCGIKQADGVCVAGECQHLNLCIMDNAIREDINNILAYKSAYVRQKNAKELKSGWEKFVREQEKKNEQRKNGACRS